MCAVSVLIADDHEIVRRGLRQLLQEQPGWQVVAEATNGRDAVAKASELKPDIAIVDISMPSLNGLDATKQMLKLSPRTKVLILTIHESDQLVHKLLNAGARGYILKADAGRDFIAAVKALLSNKTFLTPKVPEKMIDVCSGKGPKASEEGFSQITGRKRAMTLLGWSATTLLRRAPNLSGPSRAAGQDQHQHVPRLGAIPYNDLLARCKEDRILACNDSTSKYGFTFANFRRQ